MKKISVKIKIFFKKLFKTKHRIFVSLSLFFTVVIFIPIFAIGIWLFFNGMGDELIATILMLVGLISLTMVIGMISVYQMWYESSLTAKEEK